jgi:hypothetical protein
MPRPQTTRKASAPMAVIALKANAASAAHATAMAVIDASVAASVASAHRKARKMQHKLRFLNKISNQPLQNLRRTLPIL